MNKKLAVVLLLVGLLATVGFAAQNANDNSGDPAYQSGWVTGTNGGTGFGAWTLSPIGSSGSYIGATGLPGGNHFGLFSGDGSGNAFFATRSFAGGALTAGQTFSIDLGHTTISGAGGDIGLSLLDNGGAVFTLKAVQGGANWLLNDGAMDFSSGATDADNTAFTFRFTYNGGNSYSYTIGSGSGTNFTANDNISNITGFRLFSSQQGANQNAGFDNIAVVPEPSILVLLAGPALLGGWFFLIRRRTL